MERPFDVALGRLGIDRLVLGIHEAALPSSPGCETGRGSLPARGGLGFARFARERGFNGLQLGPSGMTDLGNASPYDGTIFSKNLMAADLEALAEDSSWAELLPRRELHDLLARLPAGAATRIPYAWACEVYARALATAWNSFRRRHDEDRLRAHAEALERFTAKHSEWLVPDGLYPCLAARHGDTDWRRWPSELDRRLHDPTPGQEAAARRRWAELRARCAEPIAWWSFVQYVLQAQRQRARTALGDLGLALYGDIQVGMALRDMWRLRGLFLPGYRMGAPPSRTNPDGQAWGFPVLHPGRYFNDGSPPSAWPIHDRRASPGPVLRFLDARFAKAFTEYEAVRIDHPHGLVCPWVYRADEPDPHVAARAGARLLGSPDTPTHPELARWAIPRPEQIHRGALPWGDERVVDLDDRQVARYATALERLAAAARTAGRGTADIVCEVLSTQPAPLGRVLERYGMGRFRVTQKADLERPDDVYRSENARPEDWVMLATHDTPSIWSALEGWCGDGSLGRRAQRLAELLEPDPARREAFAGRLVERPGELPTAMLAELLACPASQVFVFFTDLLGIAEPYNRPGVVSPENWSLRVPPDYRERYSEERAAARTLDLERAAALALRSRGLDGDGLAAALTGT